MQGASGFAVLCLLLAMPLGQAASVEGEDANAAPVPELAIPAAEPLECVELASPRVLPMPGGAELWLLERDGLPLVELQILLAGDTGSLDGREVLEERLLVTLLDRGLEARLQPLGARLVVGRTTFGPSLVLRAPSDGFERAFAVVAERLERPEVARRDVRTTLARWREDEARSHLSAGRVTQRAELHALFGWEHPLTAFPALDDARGLGPCIVRERAKDLRQGDGLVLLAGDVDAALAEHVSERLAWLGPAEIPALSAPEPPEDGPRVVLVDHGGTGWVRVAVDFVVRPDSSAAHVELLAELLGGGATARLDRRLRDELGLVYGARARVHAWSGATVLRVETRMAVEDAEQGLGALADMLADLAGSGSPEPVTEPELRRARATALFAEALSLDSLQGAADLLRQQALLGQEVSDRQCVLDAMAKASVGDIEAVASIVLAPERATWVLVGPAEALLPSLENVGLPPSELWSSRRATGGAAR